MNKKRSSVSTPAKRKRVAVNKASSLTRVLPSRSLGIGFPQKLTLTHKYVENIAQTHTSGAVASFIFSMNGMYDPNISGTGHQPMYFDQLTTLYDHYCVIGSKISFKINTASGLFRTIAYVEDNASIISSSTQYAAEHTNATKLRFVQFAQAPPTLTLNWSAQKYFGKSPLANTELQGTSAANPTEQSYGVLLVEPVDATTVTSQITVEIEYIAVWKELKDLSPS